MHVSTLRRPLERLILGGLVSLSQGRQRQSQQRTQLRQAQLGTATSFSPPSLSETQRVAGVVVCSSLRLQARIWFWGRWALRFRRRCGVQHSEVEAWLLGSKTLRPIVGFFFLCVLINSHCAVVLRRERVFSPCLRSTGSTANSIPSHPALVQSRSPSSLRCSAAAT